jgi:SAM-dependent methyltransferase
MIFTELLRQLRNNLDGMFVLRRKNLQVLAKYIKGDVLEVGVGYGPDIEFIKSIPGVKSYKGSEREEFYSTYTDKKIKDPNIVYYEGDLLPFKNKTFDTVISIDCLEHLHPKDIDMFFKEIYRVLNNSGTFIVLAPFIYAEHCPPYDYFRYTRYGITELIRQFGFRKIVVHARSSTFETFIVTLNHRIFFNLFPKSISVEFGYSEKSKNVYFEFLRYILLPVSASVYMVLQLLLLLVSNLTFNRNSSTFSLGYSVVFRKQG